MITIHFVSYNEEVRLQFMLDHYKSRFPTCHFVVYDNFSTDETVNIALRNNCEIIPYNTDNTHNDELLRNLKNNCWKTAKTDWVLVCDPDELFDVNEDDLKYEESVGTTIIRATGYNMVNMSEDPCDCELNNIKYGMRSLPHDKMFIFNKKHIKEINFNHGSHVASPAGDIKFNSKQYNMYHYHFINTDFIYNRYQATNDRLAEINKKMGWGIHCSLNLEELNKKINNIRLNAIKIR